MFRLMGSKLIKKQLIKNYKFIDFKLKIKFKIIKSFKSNGKYTFSKFILFKNIAIFFYINYLEIKLIVFFVFLL